MRSTHDLITKDFVLGVDINTKSVHLLDNERVLYVVGRHVICYNRFSRKQKFMFECLGSEVIQAIAVCPSKRSLAVAILSDEGAFVFLFDIKTQKRKKTINLAQDFGMVIKLSLSSDSTLLILGGGPSYNMALWHLEKSPKLQAIIKLATPSGKMIKEASICPMDNGLICVIGYCNLRFFRIIDNIFRPVTVTLGREQQNYCHHCWISKDEVVLSTENELIILINFTVKYCINLNDWGQNISSMANLSRGILIGGDKGSIRLYQKKSRDSNVLEIFKEVDISEGETSVQVEAIDCYETGNYCICLTSERRMRSFELSSFETLEPVNHKDRKDVIPYFHTFKRQDFVGGSREIISMSVCPWKPLVATVGSDRCIIILNYEDARIHLRHNCLDDISNIALHPCSTMILICFHTHVQMCSIHNDGLSHLWSKETEEKPDICAFSHGGGQFVYCTGRYVHVFDTYSLNFVATLRGHSSPITSICWRKGAHQLATFGEDSVICMWNTNTGERLARISNENFNFISGYMTDDWSRAYLNTVENLCQVYNFKTAVMEGFKEELMVHTLGSNVFIGDSKCPGTSNGKVVVVTLDPRNQQTTELYLHSKSLTQARLSFDNEHLFTASSDGSLCISKLQDTQVPVRQYKYNENAGPIALRDILVKKKDIDNLDQRIEDLSNELHIMKEKHEHEFVEMTKSQKTTSEKLEKDIINTKMTYMERIQVEKSILLELQQSCEKKLKQHSKHLVSSIEKSRGTFNKRLDVEKTKVNDLIFLNDQKMKSLEDEYCDMKVRHHSIVQLARSEYIPLIQDAKQTYEALSTDKEVMLAQHKTLMKAIDEKIERKLSNALEECQIISAQETRALTLLREEYDISKKKYDEIYKDFEEQNETLSTLKDAERNLVRVMDELKDKTIRTLSCTEKQNKDNREKERCLEELNLKILEQERINLENSNRLHTLNVEHSKKDSMLQTLCHQSRTIEEELKSLMLKKAGLEVMKRNHSSKIKVTKRECSHKDQATSLIEENIIAIKLRMRTIQELHTRGCTKENIAKIKQHLKELLEYHHSCNSAKEEAKGNSHERQSDVENLKKKIRKIKENHTRGLKRHEEHLRRLENEGLILSKQFHELLRRLPSRE